MMTSPRRSALSPPVIRHFEFTRFQNQAIALAYQVLIPILSRHLERPRSRRNDNESAQTTIASLRSKAQGA
jgi:hypothetical protein